MNPSSTFVLPTLPTTGMSTDDQRGFLTNQATTVIVLAYLSYLTELNRIVPPASTHVTHFGIVTTEELVSLINEIQVAIST